MSVGPAISHGLADDSRARFEPPFQLTVVCVDGLEPSVQCAVKNQIACRRKRATPQRQILFDLPRGTAFLHVPCGEGSAVAARARIHFDIGADVRCAGDVVGLVGCPIHAEICVGNVNQAGTRGVRGRVPILGAGRGRTNVAHHLAQLRLFFIVVLQAPALQIDALGAVDVTVRICGQHLAARSIDDVQIAVAFGPDQYWTSFSVDRHVDQNDFVDGVIVI